MTSRSDTAVVVGAGPWGVAAALSLCDAGWSVTLLDDTGPAAGHAAAGMLGPASESEPGRDALSERLHRAAGRWPGFAATLAGPGIDAGYRRCGTIHVAVGREQIAPLRRRAEQMAAAGSPADWLPARDLRRIEPGLGPAVGGGLHLPDEHQVDPRALRAALAARAESCGVRRIACGGAEIVRRDGRAVGVVDARGEHHPGQVVLAAGWRSAQLSDRVPLRGVKGQIIRLATPVGSAPPCRHVIRTGEVYVVPRPTGEVVVGATMEERTDRNALAGDVHRLLDDALRAVPDLAELTLREAIAGVRPATADGAPAIGRDEENVIWAVGGFRHGVLLTPLVGELVVAAARGDDVPGDWDPIRFARERRARAARA